MMRTDWNNIDFELSQEDIETVTAPSLELQAQRDYHANDFLTIEITGVLPPYKRFEFKQPESVQLNLF